MKVTYLAASYSDNSIEGVTGFLKCLDWKGVMRGALWVRGIDGPVGELNILLDGMSIAAARWYVADTYLRLLASVPEEGPSGSSAMYGNEMFGIRVEW